MKQPLASDSEIRAADQYLKSYRLNSHILRLAERERKISLPDPPWEDSMARVELFRIRHFVMCLDNSDEKLLLYYHYLRGESVESCAELLGISRSSAFRLKRRALSLAASKLGGREGDALGETF